jgi:hypothetical protein
VGRTLDEHLAALRRLGSELGRAPTAREIDACAYTASAATYVRRFGSLPGACSQAGLERREPEGPSTDEMLEAAIGLALELGRLPGWNDWVAACERDPELPSQWQVYRRFGGEEGAWRLFNYHTHALASERGIELPS